jgi:hypothetical protein
MQKYYNLTKRGLNNNNTLLRITHICFIEFVTLWKLSKSSKTYEGLKDISTFKVVLIKIIISVKVQL